MIVWTCSIISCLHAGEGNNQHFQVSTTISLCLSSQITIIKLQFTYHRVTVVLYNYVGMA